MPLHCTNVELALRWRCFKGQDDRHHVRNLEANRLSAQGTTARGGFQFETVQGVGRRTGPGTRRPSAITTLCRCRALYVAVTLEGTSLSLISSCLNSSSHLNKACQAVTVECEVEATLDYQPQDSLGRRQGSSGPPGEFGILCEEGLLDTALQFLMSMHERGTLPSASMYRTLLRECSRRKALVQAKRLHAFLAKHGLEISPSVGEYMVSTLIKCGALQYAVQVFHRLSRRTVVCWSVLISGYTVSGQGQEALRLYQAMQQECLKPNKYTFVSVLKACASVADLEEGRRIHADVIKHGCAADLLVGTCLAAMYANCGSIEDAQAVFYELPHRDVVLWTTMLAAYTQHGQPEDALRLYEEMLEEGVNPNDRTLVSALQACCLLAEKEPAVLMAGQFTKVESLKIGQVLHSYAWSNGYNMNVFVVCTLIATYGKCGSIANAQYVFDRLAHRDMVTWTAMVTAWVEQGQAEEVLKLYIHMQQEGVSPDARTYVACLQACAMVGDGQGAAVSTKLESLKIGMAMHAHAWRKGYDSDVFVGSALVSMYGKCGRIVDMQNLFDGLSHRNVVSWNALLVVYIEQGQANMAAQLYEQMQEEGVSPSARTFVNAIQACCILAEKEGDVLVGGQLSKVESLGKGRVLHAHAERKGYGSDVFVGNTLVNMYGKCGSSVDAQRMFEGLSRRHVVSWNVIIAAHVMKGDASKAFDLYRQMEEEGVKPDDVTLLSILQASGKTGSLSILKQIHRTLVSSGNLLNPFVASALITGYGRCASMPDARIVFDGLPQPDVVSWNALIAAYSQVGNFAGVLRCYDQMVLASVKPNGVTFLSLLSACSHAGFVDKAVELFESMSRDHGIAPSVEHYASMVDLFGRAGCFSSVEDLLMTMPVQPDLALWLCVLGVCRKHGQVVLAEQAFGCAVFLEPKHSAAYIMMSNIYADARLWDHAKQVQELERKTAACKKPPGQSWMQHQQAVYTFLVGDSKCTNRLYDVLGKLTVELENVEATHDSRYRTSKRTFCANL